MDITDFNRKLSIFITDARTLEKTDRKRANAMWLKICEFAIEYSKQKNVDRSLRLRIWKQVDIILQKVKGEEVSPAAAPTPATSETKDVPFEVDFGFDFPSVPKNEVEKPASDSKSVQFQSGAPPEDVDRAVDEEKRLFQDAVSDSTPKEELKVNVNDFVERIKKMEEELRSMPDIFKEIKPADYTPDKSIIHSSAPPPSISPEHPTEVVTAIEQGNALKIDPVERPDTIDPYKGTKDKVEIKDPFGPDAQPPSEKKTHSPEADSLHCYACGAPIGEKDTACKKCGAEL
ncbi:MAG: hypothetical protein ACTSRD_00560 [Promethearchaeota archaeon]